MNCSYIILNYTVYKTIESPNCCVILIVYIQYAGAANPAANATNNAAVAPNAPAATTFTFGGSNTPTPPPGMIVVITYSKGVRAKF